MFYFDRFACRQIAFNLFPRNILGTLIGGEQNYQNEMERLEEIQTDLEEIQQHYRRKTG